MLFSFLVFIVWKTTINNEIKDQVLINIRKLNDLVIFNIYLFIILSVRDYG